MKKEQSYSSLPDTRKHIECVNAGLGKIIGCLHIAGEEHDRSKLREPELSYFDEYTPKLASSTYGSDEYKQNMKGLKSALDHHYAENRHHPEHFENGIRGMNLVDLVEMFCDWYAATKRHSDGNIMRSIAINQERFSYSDDIKAILENTYDDIFKESK